MRKRKRMWLLATVGAALVAGGMDASADIMIDNFETPDNASHTVEDINPTAGAFSGTNTSYHTAASGSDIYQYTRKLFVDLHPGGEEVILKVNGFSGFSSDAFSPDPSHGAEIDPSVAHITWDGTQDLTSVTTTNIWNWSNENYFAIKTNQGNNVDTKIGIQVWNTGGYSETKTYQLLDANPASPHQYFFDFGDFAGINFGSISAVRLHFLTDDISIDAFQTVSGSVPVVTAPVPLPGAAALGLFGMGLVVARRRKQNASA